MSSAREIAQRVWNEIPTAPPLESRKQMFDALVSAANAAFDEAAALVTLAAAPPIDFDSIVRARNSILQLKE